jgi:cytidine deaminase
VLVYHCRAVVDWEPLIAAAREAAGRAYAPYSRFPVGAALLMEDGSIVAGCNVENRSYGLTVCAERTAIGAAVARGLRRPQALAVVTTSAPPSAPCGMCRESLREFASDLPVMLVNPDGGRIETSLAALLPFPFELPRRD